MRVLLLNEIGIDAFCMAGTLLRGIGTTVLGETSTIITLPFPKRLLLDTEKLELITKVHDCWAPVPKI